MQLVRRRIMNICFVPIFLIISATSIFADTIMRCNTILYKYESNFFGADQILVRWDGVWQPWCDKGRLEMKDGSATCWAKKDREKEIQRDFPTISAVEYAYAFCKCGYSDYDDANSDCLSRYGLTKTRVFLSSLDVGVERRNWKRGEITNRICPATEARSLDEVQAIFRNQADLLRYIFPEDQRKSNKPFQPSDQRIDFLGHVLQFDWGGRTLCELVDE